MVGRIRKSLRMYSRMDPESPIGAVLLKAQFVAKSWEDIRKKLEKTDGWQDRELQELLQEAQKIDMRRMRRNRRFRRKC